MQILFVFSSQLLMEGIKTVLEKLFPDSVYERSSTFTDFERLLHKAKWDLLIVEADNNAIDALGILKSANEISPRTKTVFVYDNLDRRVLQAYRKGLKGSFTTLESKEGVELAFKTIVSGQIYLPQSVIMNVICEGHVFSDIENQISLLSEKEKAVLALLCQGKRMKEISQIMKLAPSTLSTHKHRIIRKMGIASPQEFYSFLKQYAAKIRENDNKAG